MDFRIPRLPQYVVKRAQSTSVRELIQKIEKPPRSTRSSTRSTRLVPESKQMIQEMGNITRFELLKTDPKTQCTASQKYWNVGIVYCTCGHFL